MYGHAEASVRFDEEWVNIVILLFLCAAAVTNICENQAIFGSFSWFFL
jgi:hypothetical protein